MDGELTSKTGEKLTVDNEEKRPIEDIENENEEEVKFKYLVRLGEIKRRFIPNYIIQSDLNTTLEDIKAEYETLVKKCWVKRNKNITKITNGANNYITDYLQDHPGDEEKMRATARSRIYLCNSGHDWCYN